jgi:hypothetical protein
MDHSHLLAVLVVDHTDHHAVCASQAVEAPTLSIMVPLLVRGLRHDNTTAIKRKASVIIENMAKLVDNPLDAVPFLPNLLPGLEKVANEVSPGLACATYGLHCMCGKV